MVNTYLTTQDRKSSTFDKNSQKSHSLNPASQVGTSYLAMIAVFFTKIAMPKEFAKYQMKNDYGISFMMVLHV